MPPSHANNLRSPGKFRGVRWFCGEEGPGGVLPSNDIRTRCFPPARIIRGLRAITSGWARFFFCFDNYRENNPRGSNPHPRMSFLSTAEKPIARKNPKNKKKKSSAPNGSGPDRPQISRSNAITLTRLLLRTKGAARSGAVPPYHRGSLPSNSSNPRERSRQLFRGITPRKAVLAKGPSPS